MTSTVTITPTHLFTFTDESTLHSISARRLITFPTWEGNRVLDEAHVTALQTAISDPTRVQGLFTVIEYPCEKMPGRIEHRILDGQHRAAVLQRYFAEHTDAPDFPVLVRRYNTKAAPTHEDAIRIFQQINNAKPIIYRGSEAERLHTITEAFRKSFVGSRRTGEALFLVRPTCNRPFLSIEVLTTALRTYGILDRTDLTPEEIVAHAETINAFYMEDPEHRIPVTVTRTMLDRATEYAFFLGLDPKCSWLLALRTVT
jgi:hypothetical protein